MKFDIAAMVADLRERTAPAWQDLVQKMHQEERKLVLFQPQVGAEYDGDLMVVGRCTNDWMPMPSQDRVGSWLSTDQGGLTDCEEYWSNKNEYGYRYNCSPFWQAVQVVFAGLCGTAVSPPGWQRRLVWTNLYKAAPQEAPGTSAATVSEDQARMQRRECQQLLAIEIEVLKPRFVLVMTRWQGWAEDFADVLGVRTPADSLSPYGIQARGTTSTGALVIVMPHPQRLKGRAAVLQSVIDIAALRGSGRSLHTQ